MKKKKHILINLIPIKKGGGQQVASNFLHYTLQRNDINCFYLVTRGTEIHKLIQQNESANYIAVDDSIFNRFYFTYLTKRSFIKENKIKLIYTLFGPGLHSKRIPSITGCAYSNLFFPEIDFWKDYSFLKRIKLKFIDRYRKHTTLKSSAIIFENEAMQKRAHKLYGYDFKHTKLILPSISTYPSMINASDFEKRLEVINPNTYNLLFLTGWHKNKNIDIIPTIIVEANKISNQVLNCIITVSEKHPSSKALFLKAKTLGVQEQIIFFDTVKPYEVPFLFDKIDAVGLLSLLESFSNNIIEAWFFKKILFISDEEWSRAICKNAAVYVDRNNPKHIAESIMDVYNDKSKQEAIIKVSNSEIKNYPTPEEKVDLQIDYLKKYIND